MIEEWIMIGEVTAPHGVTGEVRVLPATDFPDQLSSLNKCHLLWLDNTVRLFEIRQARPHKRFWLFQFQGVVTRDDAEKLRNARLVVRRDEMMPLPERHYYVFDLIGMNVKTVAGEHVGILREVLSGPGNDVYVIRREGRPEALIPAVGHIVRQIDVQGRQMIIDPIAGLLD